MKIILAIALAFSMSACTTIIRSEQVEVSRSPQVVEPTFDILDVE